MANAQAAADNGKSMRLWSGCKRAPHRPRELWQFKIVMMMRKQDLYKSNEPNNYKKRLGSPVLYNAIRSDSQGLAHRVFRTRATFAGIAAGHDRVAAQGRQAEEYCVRLPQAVLHTAVSCTVLHAHDTYTRLTQL